MAIADVPLESLGLAGLEELHDGVDARLEVHDASRLEWSVGLPLPTRGQDAYAIELELEIPANVFAAHAPWDQLQSWTRLDGAAAAFRPGEAPSIDALRRGGVASVLKLARASEGFARHCRLSGALWATACSNESLREGLELWVGCATAAAEEARGRLTVPAPADTAEIRRERGLVDEYVSARLLEMLASAERSLATLRDSRNPRVADYEPEIARIESLIATSLRGEIEHRRAEGWLVVDQRSQASLEAYVERSSRLKKHFQEVLFLEPETYQVAKRLHNWVAAFVALVASTWAFAWQMFLLDQKPTTTSRVSSGLLVLAVLAGVVYAVKDRIKEIGREWISGNVHRFYAQRVARWRTPARRLPGRDVVVRARESFDTQVVQRVDALNPESGAPMPATIVRYVHRGTVHANEGLAAGGVRRVKHVFRYDLSPIFARLDDPVKQVPVLDDTTGRVTFTAAPRCYRVAVRLLVRSGGQTRSERATLVLHKRGLDRLEFEGGDDGMDPSTLVGLP